MKDYEVLRNTLTDSRFDAVSRYSGMSSQLRIQVEVTNLLGREVSVIDSVGTINVLTGKRGSDAGKCLIVRISVCYNTDDVIIDAGKDYSEEYCFNVIDKYKDYCEYRVVREKGYIRGKGSHTCYLVFDARKFLSLGHRIEIPDTGISIINGYGSRESDRLTEQWLERLEHSMVPDRGVNISGISVNIVDPHYRYNRAFYTLGNNVYEVDIDREGKGIGIYCGVWNRLNSNDTPVRENLFYISLEDGKTGKNDLGLTFYESITEAENSLLKDKTKKTVESKATKEENDEWQEKEKQAKVSQAWVKVAGDFIKSVLPTLLTGAKWLMGVLMKTPIPI